MIYYLYPFLLCLIPVHALFGQNIGEISPKHYFQALGLIGLIIFAGCFGLYLITNDFYTADAVFCLNFFLILYANYIFVKFYTNYQCSRISTKIKFTVYFLIAAIFLSSLIIYFSKYLFLDILGKIVFYTALVINFFIFLDIVNQSSRYKRQKVENKKDKIDAENNEETDFYPDVYHILLDSHPGFYFEKYRDEDFRTGLKKRGFLICDSAKSNYNCTHLSVPSMLNMDYMSNLQKDTIHHCEPRQAWHLYSKNKVFDNLKKMGYRFCIITDKFFTNLNKYNYIPPDGYIYTDFKTENYILNLMHYSSIFRLFIKRTQYRNFESDITKIIDSYKKHAKNETNKPLFHYMHLLAPHPPCYVDENGNSVEDNYSSESFISYQKYINKQTLEIVDCIKSNMKKNSIIIIHSDHSLDDKEFENTAYHILLAVYSDNKKFVEKLPDNCSLVNLYRYIFNNCFDKNYKYLEDKHYKVSMLTYDIGSEFKITEK